MKRWFISDQHFWHENIIKFCSRPFESVEQMNEVLLANYNDLVAPEDHVYWLGDVTLRRGGKVEREEFIKLVRAHKGHKTLFLGNHDHWDTKVYLEAGFEKVRSTWRDKETNILFSHIPIHPSSTSGIKANVHGHIHNNQTNAFPVVTWINKTDQRLHVVPYVNVSVEVIDYRPIELDELMTLINTKVGPEEGVKVGEEVIKSPADIKNGC